MGDQYRSWKWRLFSKMADVYFVPLQFTPLDHIFRCNVMLQQCRRAQKYFSFGILHNYVWSVQILKMAFIFQDGRRVFCSPSIQPPGSHFFDKVMLQQCCRAWKYLSFDWQSRAIDERCASQVNSIFIEKGSRAIANRSWILLYENQIYLACTSLVGQLVRL